jgi:hypothetical protein
MHGKKETDQIQSKMGQTKELEIDVELESGEEPMLYSPMLDSVYAGPFSIRSRPFGPPGDRFVRCDTLGDRNMGASK